VPFDCTFKITCFVLGDAQMWCNVGIKHTSVEMVTMQTSYIVCIFHDLLGEHYLVIHFQINHACFH